MICCLLAALFSGNLAVAGRMALGLAQKPSLARILVVASLAGAAALLAPAAIAHAGHYVERAKLHERSILEEILAQPICTGGAERRTH